MDSKTTKSATDRCLICGRKLRLVRGLCNTHYIQFQKAQKPLSPVQIDAFEEELIAAGKLLPSRQGQKQVASNPFLQVAEELFGIVADSQAVAAKKQLEKNRTKNKPSRNE